MTHYINIKDHKNVGDRASSPFHYFGNPCDTWGDINGILPKACPKTVVVGGGGLLHPGMEDQVKRLVQHKFENTVIWGIGSNYHDGTRPTSHTWLLEAQAVGLRDVGTTWTHVPCASCMHPAFDIPEKVPLSYEIVIYEHYDRPIPNYDNLWPVMKNDVDRVEDAIRFLASGEVVITNSFHGAYWARLLGKKVVCYWPFSTRFDYPFRENPLTVSLREGVCDWDADELIANTRPADPRYLTLCRAANIRFHQDLVVRGILEKKVENSSSPSV